MNNEIKEILDLLQEDIESNILIEVRSGVFKPLLDYITNLQQENEDLSRMCELYGKSLYNAELTDYKSRIEKAVEYIKENEGVDLYDDVGSEFIRNLLNILKGEE